MVWKTVRRLLALIIRVFVVHPIVGLSLIVGILGLSGVALMAGGTDASRLMQGALTSEGTAVAPPAQISTTSPSASIRRAPPVAPPPAVAEYIRGMTTFDSKLMWDALDQKAIQAMTSQGGSQQVLQQRLDEAKQGGATYEDVTYVGGYPLKNGEQYFFYVVTRRGFAGANKLDQIFFVFTVGPDGKIVKIE